ncbi:MAG: ABC transporter permease [Sphaerochaetaceae bacterium]
MTIFKSFNFFAFLSKKFEQISKKSSITIWILLLIFLIPVAFIVPEFFRLRNLNNVLIQMAPLGMVSIGQTFVILGGGIDMSVGSQISLVSIVASTLMTDSLISMIGVTALCLIMGAFFGYINGLILKVFPIPPLIATLCTGYFFQGVAYALHQTSGGYIPKIYKDVFTASWGLISVPFFLFLLLFIFAYVLLSKKKLGRYVYALGGNAEVLDNIGVKSPEIKIKTYVISGLTSALVGLYLVAKLRSGSSHYGDDYTLLSITAVIVGGTSMAGGIGTLSGTFAGAILVSMLTNVLNNVAFRYNLQSAYYKDIITGLILIIAMIFYRKRTKK